MRVIAVVLCAMILLGSAGDAESRKRKRAVITVRDYTSAAWEGVVEQTVADFNDIMPKGGPELRYRRMDPAPCVVTRKKRRTVIEVCSTTDSPYIAHAYRRQHLIMLNDVRPDIPYPGFVCHEMMHILTGVPDNYGALPDQSCVWGYLPQPGPFDVEQLRKRH